MMATATLSPFSINTSFTIPHPEQQGVVKFRQSNIAHTLVSQPTLPPGSDASGTTARLLPSTARVIDKYDARSQARKKNPVVPEQNPIDTRASLANAKQLAKNIEARQTKMVHNFGNKGTGLLGANEKTPDNKLATNPERLSGATREKVNHVAEIKSKTERNTGGMAKGIIYMLIGGALFMLLR